MVNSVSTVNNRNIPNNSNKTNKTLVIGTAVTGGLVGAVHGFKFPAKEIAENLASLGSVQWLNGLKNSLDEKAAHRYALEDSIPEEAYQKIQEICGTINDTIIKTSRFNEMYETKPKPKNYTKFLMSVQEAQANMEASFSTFSEIFQNQLQEIGLFNKEEFSTTIKNRQNYVNKATWAWEMHIWKKTAAGLVLGTAVGFIIDRFFKNSKKKADSQK